MARVLLPVFAIAALLLAPIVSIVMFPYIDILFFVRILGLMGFSLMSLQFILSSRFPLVERVFGQDRMIHLHRFTGILSVCLLLGHGALYSIQKFLWEGTILPALPYELPQLNGMIGLFLFLLIGIGSVFRARLGVRYEVWKRFHRISYVLYPALFLHSMVLGSTIQSSPIIKGWWIGMFALVVLGWIWRLSVYAKSRFSPFLVSEVRSLNYNVTEIRLAGKPLNHKPGQFAFLTLPADGKREPAHPFTISSSPDSTDLSFTIKAVGDYTNTVSSVKVGYEAYVQGPFGRFSYMNIPGDGPLVFIAGGVGITPFLSMLRLMQKDDPDRDVILLWGNRSGEDVFDFIELGEIQSKMTRLRIVHVFSHSSSQKLDDAVCRYGFIDLPLLDEFVDFTRNTSVFLCGPPVMVKTLYKDLRLAGVPRKRLIVERFSL